MRICIAAIGRLRDPPVHELISRFLLRCHWMVDIEELLPKNRQTEFELLELAAKSGDRVIALDERGKDGSSQGFAQLLLRWQDEGCKRLVILIGGADGLSDDLRQRSDSLWAFGSATWPHMLVRVMLCEQLYRASSIIRNHPYHRQG